MRGEGGRKDTGLVTDWTRGERENGGLKMAPRAYAWKTE